MHGHNWPLLSQSGTGNKYSRPCGSICVIADTSGSYPAQGDWCLVRADLCSRPRLLMSTSDPGTYSIQCYANEHCPQTSCEMSCGIRELGRRHLVDCFANTLINQDYFSHGCRQRAKQGGKGFDDTKPSMSCLGKCSPILVTPVHIATSLSARASLPNSCLGMWLDLEQPPSQNWLGFN